MSSLASTAACSIQRCLANTSVLTTTFLLALVWSLPNCRYCSTRCRTASRNPTCQVFTAVNIEHQSFLRMLPCRNHYCQTISAVGSWSYLNSARIFLLVHPILWHCIVAICRLRTVKEKKVVFCGGETDLAVLFLAFFSTFIKALAMWENLQRTCDNAKKAWIQQQRTHCPPWTWKEGNSWVRTAWELPLHHLGEVFLYLGWGFDTINIKRPTDRLI